MLTAVVVLHLIVALLLISLVLVQDSKGGGMGGAFGGASSNSLFGATGASSLAAKATKYMAIIFAGTCLALSLLSSRKSDSVVDSLPATPAAAATTQKTDPAAAVSTEQPTTEPAPATETK